MRGVYICAKGGMGDSNGKVMMPEVWQVQVSVLGRYNWRERERESKNK